MDIDEGCHQVHRTTLWLTSVLQSIVNGESKVGNSLMVIPAYQKSADVHNRQNKQ